MAPAASRDDCEPGRKYGCREYSLEMQLYQLTKKMARSDLPHEERSRIERRIAEIEKTLDF
ncbi:MAG: hypothetical protein JXO49_11520 [Deltaproteobacteria bacterium]|nr:hypothetical protein [Candidatus Anaeroferrophillus wilburensis]MBN2889963.1 hypothetical protein [Deltaproteobacteria bacterium]